MPSSGSYKMLFTDIGGVLGTNGWDTALRKRICGHFAVPFDEIDSRHHLVFDSFERGQLTFEEYLQRVFFSFARDFTVEELRAYTFEASKPWPETIAFFKQFRSVSGLGLALISNEGQGITEHRIRKFQLRDLADFMVISYFTGFRKPDPAIWRLALNLAQVRPEESLYIDDRELFVQAATDLGFTGIHHTSLTSTKQKLAGLGFDC